jgi:GNAT superfamily N-acetyltransferase
MAELSRQLANGASLTLTDDPERVDLDQLWDFLSTQAYWGRWRSREHVVAQVAVSWRVVSAHVDAQMVGFARAVSDRIALAYLADVYVAPQWRGQGIGTSIVGFMVDDGPGAEFRWLLHTFDAHPLYAQFGFAAPPPTAMERPGRYN